MDNFALRLPVDIPWKRTGVSYHMMDPVVCDKKRPAPMRPSVAVFEYEPPEEELDPEAIYRVSYVKVTCSVTTWGASGLEKLRKGRKTLTSPAQDWWQHGSSYSETTSIGWDPSVQDTGADFPCFGALLEVSVGPKDAKEWRIDEFPYFSDFEPKKRELYELVSETNELMSRSLEEAGVLNGGTTSTSSEIFDKDTVGLTYNRSEKAVSGGGESSQGVGLNVSNESGSRNVNTDQYSNVRSSNANQEKRETLSHTTQLSQMYQQLTSYHLGTNRAVFFLEPRPHIAQSPRTIIDGPRQLEGIQEFFLVVIRPRKMKAICINASLETIHVGKMVQPPAELPAGEGEDPTVARLGIDPCGYGGGWDDPDEDRPYTDHQQSDFYQPPKGWAIDTSMQPVGDDKKMHAGYRFTHHVKWANVGAKASLKVDVTEHSAQIIADTTELHDEGLITDERLRARVEAEIELRLIPDMPTIAVANFAVLMNTSVCSCDESPLVHEITREPPSVVREFQLPKAAESVGKPMTAGVAGQWNSFFRRALRSSVSASDRYPRGAVTLWETDSVKEALSDAATGNGWTLRTGLADLRIDLSSRNVSAEVRDYLRAQDGNTPVGQMLRAGLRQFAEGSGLALEHAAEVRRLVWDQLVSPATISPTASAT